MNTIRLAAIADAAVLAGSVPASAHHSHAMYDQHKETTITGKVKAFAYTNPHVYLYVDVANGGAKPTTYIIEMSHVQNMIRRGITASTFREGDTITVNMNPLNNGQAGGSYTSVIDAKGKKYDGRS